MMGILFFVATGYLTDRLMGATGAASTRLGTLACALLPIAVTLAGTVAVSRRLGWYRSPISDGFRELLGVGVLLEPYYPTLLYTPDVSELCPHTVPGCFVGSGVAAQDNHTIAGIEPLFGVTVKLPSGREPHETPSSTAWSDSHGLRSA
jgi:hypothetical protein